MIINHNITALNTHRQLAVNTANTSKNIEKLSSGLRINRAGDDAAGLAISEKMRGQIRGLDQASRNSQDGISLIQTAEGALNETHSILQRMRELAVQAGNGTNTGSDRNEIQKELGQLNSEIDRISSTTEFNTQTLLNGSLGAQGSSVEPTVVDVVSATGLIAGDYEVQVTKVASKLTKASAGGSDDDKVKDAVAAGALVINGIKIDTTGVTDVDGLKKAVNAVSDKTGVEMSGATGGALTLTATTYGSNGKIDFSTSNAAWKDAAVFGDPAATGGIDAEATIKTEKGVTTAITGIGQKLIYGSAEFKATATTAQTGTDTTKVTVSSTGTSIHIGANADQTMLIDINQMDTTTLGNEKNKLKDVNVLTTKGAEQAITTLDDAIKQVSGERSKLGAFQNRLEHTINNLNTSSENLTAAESRVRDVDMAKEMMSQTKNSILAQAAQAMLAQANQQPQGVLQLLR
jgi:flagellin